MKKKEQAEPQTTIDWADMALQYFPAIKDMWEPNTPEEDVKWRRYVLERARYMIVGTPSTTYCEDYEYIPEKNTCELRNIVIGFGGRMYYVDRVLMHPVPPLLVLQLR